MNKTSIEWVKNPDGTQGYTWNPITGCLNHTPEGLCLGGNFPCYAFKLANGRLRQRYLANTHLAPKYKDEPLNICIEDGKDPFYPRFWEDRLEMYGAPVKPCGIFVCDMGELFGDWVPREWQEKVFEVIRGSTGDRFYLLTKQPQNLSQFSPFPDNCWVGVTLTTGNTYEGGYLCHIEAKVKFISFEPLLQWAMYGVDKTAEALKLADVNWVIIGAQTKPYKPPKVDWVQEIVEACDKAGIPVFLKDNLKPLLCRTVKGHDVIESHNLWAFKQFKLRQEMPVEGV